MAGFVKLEQMEVWKRGCRLVVKVYKATNEGALEHDWGLRDQIRRAAVAIPSNIAEGYERGTPVEFRRFVQIAKGSCGELRTQLYLAQALGYIARARARNLSRSVWKYRKCFKAWFGNCPSRSSVEPASPIGLDS